MNAHSIDTPVFIDTRARVIRASTIDWVDVTELEVGRITVHHSGEQTVLTGSQLMDALMVLKPSALEGRALRWRKHAWILHNFVGHPLMHLLAFAKRYRLAIWMHDVTVPRPIGFRDNPRPTRIPT